MARTIIDHDFSFGKGSCHNQGQEELPFQTNNGPLKILLLHGNLDICVEKAKNLPNMDMFHKTMADMVSKFSAKVGSKTERVSSKISKFAVKVGSKIEEVSSKITSDPYVTISVSGAVIGRTSVINNSENPVWMQHFNIPVAHYAADVHFVVKDNDIVNSQIMGAVGIPVEQLCLGTRIEGTFPIIGANGKPCKPGAALSLSIQFTPIQKLEIYRHGVGAGPDYKGVPGTYFPLRRGGKVTLYQDAHVHESCVPDWRLDGNVQYESKGCWRDISKAIGEARRLIYITGWSVNHQVRLVRDGNDGTEFTLGGLLKAKSQGGVRVLLLVWDDPTSMSILGYKKKGTMDTNDEETRSYFKRSSVQVLLCPRSSEKGHSFIKKQEAWTIYSHHQKTVIVDADAGNGRRKIIAFVGGLDLCSGRYDTPQHPLFRTLQTTHKGDVYNPTFEKETGGPRQPWHDLHCQIDGPAAYDVLANFEERWSNASKPRGLHKLKQCYGDDSLLKLESIPEIMGMVELPCVKEHDREGWHVQVFRSIDSNSVKGFQVDPKDAVNRKLLCGKNVLIDMSIHSAYVKAIRSAQNFIYIENQYFLGSSYNWDSYNNRGANNLIPMEIALKIANKIRANERFSAYILIPMWPEGDPTGDTLKGKATQGILFWQHKTMQMMYTTIYKTLVEVGLENTYEPQDYLNFFCLGNREALDEENNLNSTSRGNPQAQSQKSRRFMIYVHSKGMIVDDEYVILGSANINQRSMDGTRDTEIAMGAYQPQHTIVNRGSRPRGQICGYRMSLWAEHMGTLEECFKKPESLECVRRVRAIGEQNWRQFAADNVTEMKAHLLKYPVEVDRTGEVKAMAGCETFPDVGGGILGFPTVGNENVTI